MPYRDFPRHYVRQGVEEDGGAGIEPVPVFDGCKMAAVCDYRRAVVEQHDSPSASLRGFAFLLDEQF